MVAVLVESPVVSADELVSAARAVRVLAAGFDAGLVSGDDARRVAEELVGCERAVFAARISAAYRAGGCFAFPRGDGVGDAADWLARLSGVTRRKAADELRLADRLSGLAATRGALAGGLISAGQAEVIAGCERDAPGHEADLLALAVRADVATLRAEARRLRQEAIPPGELAARRRKARYHRHWVNDLGMTCGSYAVSPEDGVPMVTRIDAETDRRVRADAVAANHARRTGAPHERQTRDQHAADAFVALTQEGGRGKAGRADVVIVGDIRTLIGGDEVGGGCRTVGGGPMPAQQMKDLIAAGDAFIKYVLHDGVNVVSVKHVGRKIPAELLTALRLGAPPLFDGPVCAKDGCGRRWGLQLDHRHPVAAGGPSSLDNLWHLCWIHHQEKTARDRAQGWLTPAAPDDPERAPP